MRESTGHRHEVGEEGSGDGSPEAGSPYAGTRLKQFFSYFGSKVSLAKKYPAPEFGTIIEPFAGSAGYACQYPESEVLLFDVDPVIVSVWNFLIQATRQDIISLPIDPAEVASLSAPERAFIGFWWRRCGAEPSLKPVPWMKTGLHPYSFWGEKTRARIADQVHRINHWKCWNRNYAEVRKIAGTWFIDPPYQAQGIRYIHGSKRIDYPALGAWVQSLPGQKIVCESAGADWLPFRPLYENRTVKYKKTARTITEVVYTSMAEGPAKPEQSSLSSPSPHGVTQETRPHDAR
jgi:hypothetical protein